MTAATDHPWGPFSTPEVFAASERVFEALVAWSTAFQTGPGHPNDVDRLWDERAEAEDHLEDLARDEARRRTTHQTGAHS